MLTSYPLTLPAVLLSLYGWGIPEDYTESIKWFRKSAEQWNTDAQLKLGLIFQSGNGVPQDYTKAVKWYRKAAEQGNATAQYYLGFMYDQGLGVPEDDTESVKWYRKAAEQGHILAQNVLGLMCQAGNGDGVPQDYVEAYMWYDLSKRGSAKKAKSKLSRKMSKEQIAEAQAMSCKWLEDFKKKNNNPTPRQALVPHPR